MINQLEFVNSNDLHLTPFVNILNQHKAKCSSPDCKCSNHLNNILKLKLNSDQNSVSLNDELEETSNLMVVIDGAKQENKDNFEDLRINSSKKEISKLESLLFVVSLVLERMMVDYSASNSIRMQSAYLNTYYKKNVFESLFEMMKMKKEGISLEMEFDFFVSIFKAG